MWLGFGAAFTDAAADTLARVPAPLQKQLLGELFGPHSVGYSLGRVPIAGTDFSPRAYTYYDGTADVVELRRFNASADDVHRIPLLQKALALEPENVQALFRRGVAPEALGRLFEDPRAHTGAGCASGGGNALVPPTCS